MLKRKSAFAAATHVLSYSTLDRYTEGRIDHENERIDWEGIFDQKSMMSNGEQIQLNIALALWNGNMAATIASLSFISDEPLTLVVEAIIALRDLHPRGD